MSKKETELAVVEQMPAFLMGVESARGVENVGADDLTIPRLELIQSLSPCRKKSDPSYIEGADEGMMFNSLTRELYGDSVLVVPVYYKKEWIIWKNRAAGGGYRGAYPSQAAAIEALETLPDRDSCDIQLTAQHFCLLVKVDGSTEDVVLSLSRSKLKMSRKWNSLMRVAGGDSFSRVYKVSSYVESNAAGQDYHNLTVSAAGFPTESVYRRAESLYRSVVAGGVVADSNYAQVVSFVDEM
jgi:hypothetical protein